MFIKKLKAAKTFKDPNLKQNNFVNFNIVLLQFDILRL